MAYSFSLMTLIFIKPPRREAGRPARRLGPERASDIADTRLDVRRLVFDGRVTEATHQGNRCVSTPSLCNANFARS
jgi:hypothetical protein